MMFSPKSSSLTWQKNQAVPAAHTQHPQTHRADWLFVQVAATQKTSIHQLPPACNQPHAPSTPLAPARGQNTCASSVLVTPPPSLRAALGSTVPIIAPMCHRSTCCPTAQGCPPCPSPSCRHLNCPTFPGQAAKTASAAIRKGELSPLVGAESLGNTQRMEIPSCPKPQSPTCNTRDGLTGPPARQASLQDAAQPPPREGSMTQGSPTRAHTHPPSH